LTIVQIKSARRTTDDREQKAIRRKERKKERKKETMYVALGHESRVVVAPKRPTLRSLTNKWVQIALVKPVKVNVFFLHVNPKRNTQKRMRKHKARKAPPR